MRIAIVNVGSIVSGDLDRPLVAGDTIVTEDDRIVSVGTATAQAIEACDVVIDADRTTAIPGLIDSHVHITFGDYTPRQQTVGYLERGDFNPSLDLAFRIAEFFNLPIEAIFSRQPFRPLSETVYRRSATEAAS